MESLPIKPKRKRAKVETDLSLRLEKLLSAQLTFFEAKQQQAADDPPFNKSDLEIMIKMAGLLKPANARFKEYIRILTEFVDYISTIAPDFAPRLSGLVDDFLAYMRKIKSE